MSSGTNGQKTIEKLRNTFTTFGLPEEIVSDNGPPFCGVEYKQFCSKNGIKCTFSPPYHPKSNGFAERQVCTIKRNLEKQLLENRQKSCKLGLQHQIDCFLFSFRNTPHSITKICPSEMVFKKKPRTKLDLLRPPALSREIQETTEKRIRAFVEGQKVLVYVPGCDDPKWKHGKICKVVSNVTYLVLVDGEIKFIHADHLKPSFIEDLDRGKLPMLSSNESVRKNLMQNLTPESNTPRRSVQIPAPDSRVTMQLLESPVELSHTSPSPHNRTPDPKSPHPYNRTPNPNSPHPSSHPLLENNNFTPTYSLRRSKRNIIPPKRLNL